MIDKNTSSNKQENLSELDGEVKSQSIEFHPIACQTLRIKVSEYISYLVNESARNAMRENLNNVSATHVHNTSERLLVTRKKRIYEYFNFFGPLLVGAALSNLGSMLLEHQYPELGVVFTIIAGMLGMFMSGIGLSKNS